jgi:hypothetical protein
MSSSGKLKQRNVTLSANAQIIKKLDKGEILINLVKEYGVGRVMIYDIRQN